MNDQGASLVLSFDTDDEQFCRGFEAGALWRRLQLEDGPVTQEIHATNAEMAMRMGEATNRSFAAGDLDDAWVEVTFGEADDER